MAKHILLTFLSDVKKNRSDRTCRPNLVSKSDYKELGETYTTNESALFYLLKNGWHNEPIQIERIFAFASNTVLQNPVGAVCEGQKFPDVSVDEKGISLTHYEYFKKRIAGFVDVNVCIYKSDNYSDTGNTVLKYNEDSQNISDTMGAVIGMAGNIQLYLKSVKEENPEETVVLHADMTGGFRHAAMMMIAVMRLIQFAGIDIGHVLYSNWTRLPDDSEYSGEGFVQEVGDIYGMYDLVAGAVEFSNFGSVRSFNDYFSTKPQSEHLRMLLHAMNSFDEAIKISRRREFDKAVQELKAQLANFQDHVKDWTPDSSEAKTPTGLNDLLMYSFKNRIEQDYQELLDESADVLVFVEWCLKHGYLQQALTLFTEGFPDFINENGFITITEKGLAEIKCSKQEEDPRDDLFYLLAECVPAEIPVLWLPEPQLKQINGAIKQFFISLNEIVKTQDKAKRNTDNQQISVEDLKQQIDRYEKEIETYLQAKCQKDKRPIFKNDITQICDCLKVVRKLEMNGFRNVLLDMDEKEIGRIQGFAVFDKKDLSEPATVKRIVGKLNSSCRTISADRNPLIKVLNRDKYQYLRQYKRCSKIEQLMYCKDIELNNLTPEEVLPILDSYFEIRAIRNDMAHAKKDSNDMKNYTPIQIKEIVSATIYGLRMLQKKVQGIE